MVDNSNDDAFSGRKSIHLGDAHGGYRGGGMEHGYPGTGGMNGYAAAAAAAAAAAYTGCGELDKMDIKMEADMGAAYMELSPNGQRSRKNKEDKICGVCGDRALGYNFDAISCESCKAFFRRNAPKGLDYFKCPYDEKCKMDISNRRFCKRCRLKKCFEIGMRKEYILSEEEKQLKRQKIEQNRMAKSDTTKVAPMSATTKMLRDLERTNTSSSSWTGTMQPIIMSGNNSNSQDGSCSPSFMSVRALSDDDQGTIDELLSAYDSSLSISIEKEPSRDHAQGMADLVNIAEISVRRVIDMAKKVKAFKSLPQLDQISLLKGGSIELLILRSVITFDKDKKHFLDPLDQEESSAMTIEQFRRAETGLGLFDDHMNFVKSLAVDLRADKTTLILLLMISLFSPDRPHITHKDEVAREQEHYSTVLENYLESKYPYHVAHAIFPKLLMKLTDIRNLNEEHSQVLLKVNPEGIQPLMQEVLDLRAQARNTPATSTPSTHS